MFWSIKSKWLDKLFPWRIRDIHDWDVAWWQRPFLIFNVWHRDFNGFKSRLYWKCKRIRDIVLKGDAEE